MAESFEKLNAWIAAKELCLYCYKVTKKFPQDEQFGLTQQIRRAAVSIVSNLAEGLSRKSIKDKTHFVDMAIGSAYEVKAQLIIAFELNYLSEDESHKANSLISQCLKLSNGYNNYLNKGSNG